MLYCVKFGVPGGGTTIALKSLPASVSRNDCVMGVPTPGLCSISVLFSTRHVPDVARLLPSPFVLEKVLSARNSICVSPVQDSSPTPATLILPGQVTLACEVATWVCRQVGMPVKKEWRPGSFLAGAISLLLAVAFNELSDFFFRRWGIAPLQGRAERLTRSGFVVSL